MSADTTAEAYARTLLERLSPRGIPADIQEQASARLVQLLEGKHFAELGGRRLHFSRDTIRVPVGRRYRMILLEQNRRWYLHDLLSHEDYNTSYRGGNCAPRRGRPELEITMPPPQPEPKPAMVPSTFKFRDKTIELDDSIVSLQDLASELHVSFTDLYNAAALGRITFVRGKDARADAGTRKNTKLARFLMNYAQGRSPSPVEPSRAKDTLTVKEAAELLSVTDGYIYILISDGRLSSVYDDGSRTRTGKPQRLVVVDALFEKFFAERQERLEKRADRQSQKAQPKAEPKAMPAAEPKAQPKAVPAMEGALAAEASGDGASVEVSRSVTVRPAAAPQLSSIETLSELAQSLLREADEADAVALEALGRYRSKRARAELLRRQALKLMA